MQRVRIMVLGGLSEDGKNMAVIEIDQDIFVVDCGLKYPNSEQLGVQCIIPDFTYILENKDRVKAVLITHGHDDVMAALGYLLQEADLPVYATPLTAKILGRQFDALGIRNKHVNILRRNSDVTIAGHKIHTFSVTQSIPDCIGIAFETENGQIVYSSEFIFDYDSLNESFQMDFPTLSRIGSKKVLALLGESVGAHRIGYTSPRHRITPAIDRYFEAENGRFFITLYKQNLYRIFEVLELAKKYKRRVYFTEDEQRRILQDVEQLGYYKIPSSLILNKKDFDNSLQDLIVIVSGSGNEVFRRMNRIAIGDDRDIELSRDDAVIIASPVVPGTEKEAANMEDDLYIAGVRVLKIGKEQAYSMHASQEDLKMMLNILKPEYYIPVKGEYRSLVANAEVATSAGYLPNRIVILDNGQFADFSDGHLVSTHDVLELNDTLIDGKDKLDVTGMVLKDRETLSTDGAIVLGIVLNFETKKVIGGPDVQSRGVIYLKDADYILEEVGKILIDSVEEAVREGRYDNMKVRAEAKEKISRYIAKQTGKRPMILPAIVEISEA